ncbi:MAG: Na+/H+ antiporter NhaA [Deltaproteobacteria bacterium]|nr:Na+/H+ antiporter NhaA [Deltaproteobacteria bacterium]
MIRIDPIDRLRRPIDRFMEVQASGGILLLAATLVALVWANSPWRDVYHHLWDHSLAIRFDDYELRRTLHHWINDGLMAMFFFVVGLELKREVVGGQLSKPSQAILPVAAGVGGMLFPATIYALVNGTAGAAADGWGIPMATDIAFAVGVIAVLGSRVPTSLKIFLTTLAIADDLGAVIVIALFYTSDVSLINLGIGLGFLVVLIGGNRLGIRNPVFYGLFGIGGLWLAFLLSGVHATIAGVLAAFAIPASVKIDEQGYIARMQAQLDEFARLAPNGVATLTEDQLHTIDETDRLVRHASTPLQRLEHQLHPVVVYFVLPIFALANAGVELPADVGSALAGPVALGVGLGLLVGKPVGILLVCWLTVRLGWARVGEDFSWSQLAGVAFLAGIGFTMSLFINELAFENVALRQQAKLGVLVASVLAGAVGYGVLRFASGPTQR